MDNTATNTKTHNGGFLTLATYDPNDKKIIYYKTECKGVRKKAKPIEAEKKVQSFTSNVILEFKKKDVRIGLSQAACFSKSSSYHSNSPAEVTKFIRNNSVNGKAPIYITTNIDDSGKCNVYKFKDFPAYVNDACDELMGTYIRMLQNEKPKGASKGKVLSLSQCGMLDFLTPENIAKVKKIVYSVPDRSRWPELFDKAGVSELIGTVSFLEIFNFTEMPEASISLTTYRKMLNSLEVIYNRDYFYLKRLLEVAKDNQEILLKLSLVSQLVFNKPLSIYTGKSNSMDMPTEFSNSNVIPFEPPYVKEKKDVAA